jgi:hypothetical protein
MLDASLRASLAREEDFRLMVVQKLSHLETLLGELVGDGQPGRIGRLEEKVQRHERVLWSASGAGLVIGWFLRQIVSF